MEKDKKVPKLKVPTKEIGVLLERLNTALNKIRATLTVDNGKYAFYDKKTEDLISLRGKKLIFNDLEEAVNFILEPHYLPGSIFIIDDEEHMLIYNEQHWEFYIVNMKTGVALRGTIQVKTDMNIPAISEADLRFMWGIEPNKEETKK